MIKTRVRSDTGRKQYEASDIFDILLKKRYTPASDEALFILTDADLYPHEGWTNIFSLTRASLRTSVQSIARHDECFPLVS